VTYFAGRYTIGFNQAPENCLKTSLFIIDHHDRNVKAGDLVAFSMNNENHFFPQGMQWVKRIAAEPNSTVSVSRYEVNINNERTIPLDMSGVMFTIGKTFPETRYEDYVGVRYTGDDEWFLVGETIYSYDSRFWGNVKTQDIIGKAYAIW
jgi:type IV secretory pathway protease TraF